MIRFALVCDRGHGFESWFRDNAAYADQAGAGLVTCPHCGSAKVEKSIMAPHVARSDKERHAGPVAPPATPAAPADGAGTAMTMLDPADLAMRALLRQFRRHVEAHADNVGGRFAEEAVLMHHGDIEQRPIYGSASPEDARMLIEEGIDVMPLPTAPDDRN
jgi:hypothetical protein